MVPLTKQENFSSDQAVEFWNIQAEKFLNQSRPDNSFYHKRMAVIVELICRYVRPSLTLDIGCAEGDLVLQLHQLGFDAYGTDVSQQMIDAAIRKNDPAFPDAPARFRLTQGITLPFINTFDLITIIGVLPYVADHYVYLTYLDKMLKKDGFIVITCTNPFSIYNLLQIIKHIGKFSVSNTWLSQLKNTCRTGVRSGGFIDRSHERQVHTIRMLKKILTASGYQVYETISFYNIRFLDRYPLQRSRLSHILSRLLGWTHLAIAKKSGIK